MSASGRGRRILAALALATILVGFAAALSRDLVPGFALDGADEAEHFLMARRLVEGRGLGVVPGDPYEYVPLNLIEGRDGAYHPKHPFGYPLLLAAAWRLGGPTAPFLVSPVLALIAVVGMFLFGRLLGGTGAGLAAALLLAANPLHGAYALAAMSHAAGLAFTILGLLLVWRWSLGGGVATAVLGGALCGFAGVVRYAEVLLVAPIGLAIALRLADDWRAPTAADRRRRLTRSALQATALVASGLAAYAPLLASQWAAYGSPFVTGQSITESSGIGLRYWGRNSVLLLRHLGESGLWPIFALGAAALAGIAWRRDRVAPFLAAWALVHFFLYHSFYWRDAQSWVADMRYYLDLIPPLILALVAFVAAAAPRGRARVAAFAVVLLATVPAGAVQSAKLMALVRRGNLAGAQIGSILRATIPGGAVVFTDEDIVAGLAWLGDYRVYYDLMFHARFLESYEPLLARTGPWPVSRARVRAWQALLGGRSEDDLAQAEREVVEGHLAAGRPVLFVTAGSYTQEWQDVLGPRFEIETVLERPLYLDDADRRFPSRLLSVYAIRARGAGPAALQPPAGDLAAGARTR